MEWQTILAYLLGAGAFFYVIKMFKRQLDKPEIDPKCNDCPVPDLMNKAKKNSSG